MQRDSQQCSHTNSAKALDSLNLDSLDLDPDIDTDPDPDPDLTILGRNAFRCPEAGRHCLRERREEPLGLPLKREAPQPQVEMRQQATALAIGGGPQFIVHCTTRLQSTGAGENKEIPAEAVKINRTSL